VQLGDVTGEAALIAWGGFELAENGGGWRPQRVGETFGARPDGSGTDEPIVVQGQDR